MYSRLLIDNIVKKYGKNKITEAIIYQLNNLSEEDNKIISIIDFLQNKLNKECNKDYNLINIIMALIYLYNSKIIIYNLPHMSNKIKYNNKPSLHILFGETVVQLTSISLVTECFKLINKELNDEIRYDNIKKLYDIKIDEDTIISINKNENLKENLEKLLKISTKEILISGINLCLNYYNLPDEKKKIIEEDIKTKFDIK